MGKLSETASVQFPVPGAGHATNYVKALTAVCDCHSLVHVAMSAVGT